MTALTENFNTADSDTLGPTQTWVEDVGDIDVVSNKARLITSPSLARITANLAGDNHFIEAKVESDQAAGIGGIGVIARKAGSATQTYYLYDGLWDTDVVRLFRCVTGSFTSLASNVGFTLGAAQYTVLLACAGSTISAYVGGTQTHSVADTNITGNVQVGVRGDQSSGTSIYQWDDIRAGDLSTVTLRPNADGTTTGWTKTGGTGTFASCVVDDPDSNDGDTSYVLSPNVADGQMWVALDDTPSDFDLGVGATLKASAKKINTPNMTVDTSDMYLLLQRSDETTALTAESAVCNVTETASYTLFSRDVIISGTNTKTDWDGARLRLRYDHITASTLDTVNQIRITAAEVLLYYVPTTGATAHSLALSDDAANLADSIQLRGSLFTRPAADSAANLLDTLVAAKNHIALFTDDFNTWADELLANLSAGLVALLADLPADDAANLADSITGLKTLRAALADDALNLGDSVAAREALLAAVADTMALADALAARRALFADFAPDSLDFTDALTSARSLLADLTDAADNLTDALAALRALRATLTDNADNLADALAVVETGLATLVVALSDQMGNLTDALSAAEELLADLSADSLNTWSDPLTRLIDDYFAYLPDDLNQWSDALAADLTTGFVALLAEFTDAMGNLADVLAARRALLANLAADDAVNLTDALNTAEGLLADLSDSAANLLDSMAAFKALRASLSDDSANLTDSLALFAALLVRMPDDADNLNDLLAGFVSQFGELQVSLTDQMSLADSIGASRRLFAALAADDAANLDDSLGALRVLIAQLPPDAMGNLADALAVVTAGFADLLISLPADQMGNLADTVSAVRGLLVAESDDAANLVDAVGALHGLIVALSDDGTNLSDALAAFKALYADLAADPYTLADALALFIGGLELIGTVTLSNALAHSLALTEARIGGSVNGTNGLAHTLAVTESHDSATLSDARVGSLTVTEAPADA